MATTVCLWANTLSYPEGGGHFWVYLNWALGLRAAGCDVTWLEGVHPIYPLERTAKWIALQKERLAPYGFADRLAICSDTEDALPPEVARLALTIDDVAGADLLLNLSYLSRGDALRRFKRTAMVDIDPGILQIWMSAGQWTVDRHDVYFTIGETVGRPEAKFPACGIDWNYTPPCVSLDAWPVAPPPADDAPFTTVSNWS